MRWAGLLLLVLAIGAVVKYAVWIALGAGIVVLLVLLWKFTGWLDKQLIARDERRAGRAARRAAIAARADEQNRLFLAGEVGCSRSSS
jgi:hypothetical protein